MLPSTVDYIKAILIRKSRVLSKGDEVLVLLPSSHNKLQMQWKGPHSVLKRHDNEVDYLIKACGKVKLYHIDVERVCPAGRKT